MMFSAEPGRRRAYGTDLRWRIVFQRFGMRLRYAKIARNLNVSTSTAYRICALFEATGEVRPVSQHAHRPYLRRLDQQGQLHVVGLIIENPSLYLAEICQQVQEVFALDVTPSTVCRLLREYGMTCKKIRCIALQRCDTLRGAFRAQCSALSVDKFVWIDGTGSDARVHARKYGYALRGLTPVSHRLHTRGQRINAIAAISSTGLVASELTTNTVDREIFYDFIRGTLIPQMMTFNESNPRSVAVMDNLSVHHVREVVEHFRQAGVVVLFLPAYSPDLNPMEEAFSFVKSYLRKHDDVLQVIPDPKVIIKAAFNAINAQHCKSWISHSGYYSCMQ